MKILIYGSDIALRKAERATRGCGFQIMGLSPKETGADHQALRDATFEADMAIVDTTQRAFPEVYLHCPGVWQIPVVLLSGGEPSEWAQLAETEACGFLSYSMGDMEFGCRLKAIVRRHVPHSTWGAL